MLFFLLILLLVSRFSVPLVNQRIFYYFLSRRGRPWVISLATHFTALLLTPAFFGGFCFKVLFMCQESYLSLNRFLHTYYTQNPVAPRRRSRSCKFALKPSAPTPSEESVCSRSSLSFPLPLRIYQAISFFDFTYFICLRWIVEWLWFLKSPSARELLEEIRTTFWSIFKGGPRLFFRKCPYRRALSPPRKD